MEDLLFVAATIGFFGLGLAYVRFCDRIIGPDPTEVAVDRHPAPTTEARELAEVTR